MSLIDDYNEVPTSMENWLNAGAEWSEHHGITETTTSASLFYSNAEPATPESAVSLFENLRKEHPFLKLDALEICKENPDAALLVVRTSGSPSVVESSTSGHVSEEKLSTPVSTIGGLSASSLLDRTPSLDDAAGLYVEADHSPRGPLSPAALKSPRTGSNKRDASWVVPVADLQTRSRKSPQNDLGPTYAPFVAMATAATPPAAAAPSFLPVPVPVPVPADGNNNSIAGHAAGSIAAPPAILFPGAPLTLPVVPSMEEIAQTRPKRRNVRISKDPTSVAARHRRERISDRVRVLQHFVPGGTKMDTASMLDEAIHYVKYLQQQLQMLERLGNSYDPRFMTSEDPMLMAHVGNSVRPFDLNRVCYQQTFPSPSMASHPQQPPQPLPTWPNTKATSAFCSQGFPAQFCH